MKKFSILFFVFHFSFFIFHSVSAQWGCSCLPEGIMFTNQAQIDNFPVNYPGCIEIVGDVEISGNSITNLNGLNVLTSIGGDLMMGYYSPDWGAGGGNHNLTNINALQNLNFIGGSLLICDNISLNSLNGLENISTVENLIIIGNNSLSDFTGLDGITHVYGSLKIAENSITSLEGLNNLTTVGDSVFLGVQGDSWVGPFYTGNPLLVNLDGLQNLTAIGGSLHFYKNGLIDLSGVDNLNYIGGSVIIGAGSNDNGSGGNPSLVNLTGLTSLNSINGDLIIHGNHSLLNLNGLNNLINVLGGVQIQGNYSLESLSGLNSLISIDGFLQIGSGGYSNNSALTSLTGLESLASIGGDFYIMDNDSLTNLNGPDNLTFIGGGLSIFDNSSLSTCNVQWLCDYLAAPIGVVNIEGNASGCNNVIEAAYACGGVPCLPYGNYSFNSQSDIDLFQAAFPNCTAMQGDVTIAGNDITDLSGLSAVNSIGGNLSFINADVLTKLSGLEGLTSIGGGLYIWGWNDLTSLSGLESLTSIGGSLKIGDNYSTIKLESLSGLDNLTSIGGNLEISEAIYLTSLNGLDNLSTIGGGLDFDDNYGLISLTGLESLTSIGGDFKITHTGLESLSGLDNLTFIGGDLRIGGNGSLSICDAQWLCDYLAAPNGVVNIGGNASGCDNEIEVAYACGGVPCLPYGNYSFNSQSDIDLFHAAFPNCSVLQGDVRIGGDDIINLSGLSAVNSIGGDFLITSNDALTSLTGLDNLITIGGDFMITSNDALTNLTGLDNLITIGGGLRIGGSDMGGGATGNPSLTSLAGLESLASIGGYYLRIGNNDALTSLTGLESVDASSITSLWIWHNSSLSTCAVQSICDYLAAPNGHVDISYNAPGCDSEEEVEAACLVGVGESSVVSRQSSVNIYPNPSSNTITIELSLTSPTFLTIYNLNGQQILQQQITEPAIVVDVSGLNSGIYFVRIVSDDGVMVEKIVKQ